MARPTEQIKVFAKQIGNRAGRIEDDRLAVTFMSLGAAMEWLATAIRDVYEEIHSVNVKLDRHIKRK